MNVLWNMLNKLHLGHLKCDRFKPALNTPVCSQTLSTLVAPVEHIQHQGLAAGDSHSQQYTASTNIEQQQVSRHIYN